MALMSLRSRYHIKESMVLTRAVNLFIHNYIRKCHAYISRDILPYQRSPQDGITLSICGEVGD